MRMPKWVETREFTDIRYETCEEGIARITINRPRVRNAFRPLTVKELSAASSWRATTARSAW